MGYLGAAMGLSIVRDWKERNEQIRERYFTLKELDPANSLLDLIKIKSLEKGVFDYEITPEMEKRFPSTLVEQQRQTYVIFKQFNLLEKFLISLQEEIDSFNKK